MATHGGKSLAWPNCWLIQVKDESSIIPNGIFKLLSLSDRHELPTCATKTVAELCQPLEHHKVLTFCVLNQLVSFRFTSPYLSTGR